MSSLFLTMGGNQSGRNLAVRERRGFTLIELMVSMAVLSLLGILILTMVQSVSSATKRARDQVESYQGARAGFEALTRTIAQATLNTYWDYYDSAGKPASDNAYSGTPAKYGRQSELHFRSGPTKDLFGAANAALKRPTGAVFFQVPAGFSSNSTLDPLTNILNAVGFFLEFGSDDSLRPDFLAGLTDIPVRYRYRLLQMQQPSENLQIYSPDATAGRTKWFTDPLGFTATVAEKDRPVSVLAENVIALVIIPKLSSTEDPSGAALVKTDYNYDSRSAKAFSATPASGSPISGTTSHQLPPLVEVIMVVIDESSAQRLAAANGSNPPDFGQGGLFQDISSSSDVDADLATLEKNLTAQSVNYRIYRTVVGIRGAKWSND
ncbi:MAG: Verru_Chthon cassette protein C [Terrimicrobiaceae bacterium]